jgi:hypothetical protein
MSEAIPPLPQYAFMLWCSVKKEQGQLRHSGYLQESSWRRLDKTFQSGT